MSNPGASGTGYAGLLGLNVATGDFNLLVSIFMQLMGKVRTATIVQIVDCTVNNAVGPIGLVDAQPLIGMVDGAFKVYPHGIIHNLAYMRIQGGSNAIIIDPQPNDIGLAVICDRDISVVKNTGAASPPGSGRTFDLADGVYCFPIYSQNAPQQYWQFTATGMNAQDVNGNTIQMESAGILFNGHVLIDRSGNISGVNNFTNTGTTSLSGGSTAIELFSGIQATKVKGT